MKKDKITAEPTKTLFIDILTQDVNGEDCILDLIDNSVDSYTRNEFEDSRSIKLTMNDKHFAIFDNCGGIDFETLKNDVFRFGVDVIKREKPTLGLYGIGMKRALFKIGKIIKLETDDGTTHSIVCIDIDEWKISEEWKMDIDYEKSKLNGEIPYTSISVDNLYPAIMKLFSLEPFITLIKEQIHIVYTRFISKGINISLNEVELEPFPLEVRFDKDYQPARFTETYNDVVIDIICGISPRSTKRTAYEIGHRGWNVFCNDRLILVDDISDKTGWTGKDAKLPKYHPIYNQFYGFVFLNSNNPAKLPLNTSKTGLHTTSSIYAHILDKMISTAKPVIKYLSGKYNDEKSESDTIEENIDSTIENEPESKTIIISKLKKSSVFTAPKKDVINYTTINYKKPKKIVEKVKAHMGLKSNKDVGLETFDFYVEFEGID
ncbi:MAG: ATP-binding protein [Armatimonadetes bacterium]|nr:ATP-binding protein [Armatimonadota bacterium]